MVTDRHLLCGEPVLFQPLQHCSRHSQQTTARPPRRRGRGGTAAATTFGEQSSNNVRIADGVHLEEPVRTYSGIKAGEEGVDQPCQLQPCKGPPMF